MGDEVVKLEFEFIKMKNGTDEIDERRISLSKKSSIIPHNHNLSETEKSVKSGSIMQ